MVIASLSILTWECFGPSSIQMPGKFATVLFFSICLLVAHARAEFDYCKDWRPQDWERLKEYVMEPYPNEKIMTPRLTDFSALYSKCKGRFADNDKMNQCLERLDYISRIVTKPEEAKIHAWKTNEDYFQSQIPELMDLPHQFKGGMPGNWREIAQENGWKCINFKSKLPTEGPDGAAWYRTIFLIPKKINGKSALQRLLVTSLTPEPDKTANTIQIISTEHEYDGRYDGGGDKGARINFRAYDSVHGVPKLSKGNNSCVECHFAGPIRVKPDYTFTPTFCGDYDLKTFNDTALKDATNPNKEDVLDPRLHPNPEIGVFPISVDGVVGKEGPGSVSCTTCHVEQGIRHPLIVGMGTKPLTRLPFWRYEIDLHRNMPPGKKLSDEEWGRAKKLLNEEQIQGVKSWLAGFKCEG